ncbi:MAG: hypothetical protein ACKN9E_13510 [Microcystaceae cyanobacterium]
MVNPKILTDADGEVHELTEEDLQTGVNFSELPKNLQIKLNKTKNNVAYSTHRQPISQ